MSEWRSYDYGNDGFESAAGHSVVDWSPRRPKAAVRDPRLCAGKNNTCKGFHTKDSIFCAGHNKAEKAAS